MRHSCCQTGTCPSSCPPGRQAAAWPCSTLIGDAVDARHGISGRAQCGQVVPVGLQLHPAICAGVAVRELHGYVAARRLVARPGAHGAEAGGIAVAPGAGAVGLVAELQVPHRGARGHEEQGEVLCSDGEIDLVLIASGHAGDSEIAQPHGDGQAVRIAAGLEAVHLKAASPGLPHDVVGRGDVGDSSI